MSAAEPLSSEERERVKKECDRDHPERRCASICKWCLARHWEREVTLAAHPSPAESE